jgi:hypothetical protein
LQGLDSLDINDLMNEKYFTNGETVSITLNGKTKSYKIPALPKTDLKWIMPGSNVNIDDYAISCGFFYFGQKNASIDYGQLFPEEYPKYLEWLSLGRPLNESVRNDFLLLFLHGLEQRIINDAKFGIVKDDEKAAIKEELLRMIDSIASSEIGLRKCFVDFYLFLKVIFCTSRIYKSTIEFPLNVYSSVPEYIKLAFAQCVKDKAAIPAELAFYYYECATNIKRPLPLRKCASLFKRIFIDLYTQQYDDSTEIKKTGKALHRYVYRPSYQKLPKFVQYTIHESLHYTTSEKLKTLIKQIGADCNKILKNYANLHVRLQNTTEAKFCFLLLPQPYFCEHHLSADDIMQDANSQDAFFKAIRAAARCDQMQKTLITNYLENDVFVQCKTEYKIVQLLEKVYKLFKMDSSALYNGSSNSAQKDIVLDKNKIQSLKKDSQEISVMLQDIFADTTEQGMQSAAIKKRGVQKNSGKAKNINPLKLNKKYTLFLADIIKKEVWEKSEIESLAKVHRLMPQGAVEIINEAVFSTFDEALIEVDNCYRCNLTAVKKIKEMFAA